MKAIEYFEKYGESIIDEYKRDSCENARKLLLELSQEVETIAVARKCASNSATVAVLREVNQKWNAICALYEKKYGGSPLKRDGFMEFWKARLPELKNKA